MRISRRRRMIRKIRRRLKSPKRFYRLAKKIHKKNRVPRNGFSL